MLDDGVSKVIWPREKQALVSSISAAEIAQSARCKGQLMTQVYIVQWSHRYINLEFQVTVILSVDCCMQLWH